MAFHIYVYCLDTSLVDVAAPSKLEPKTEPIESSPLATAPVSVPVPATLPGGVSDVNIAGELILIMARLYAWLVSVHKCNL